MYDTLDEVLQLLIKRERDYQDTTDEILGRLNYLTDGVSQYLALPSEVIQWNNISLIMDDFILVVTIPFEERFRWVDANEKQEQVLTIVVPSDIVETFDADQIEAFLHESEDVRKMDQQEEADEVDPTGIVAYANVTTKVIH